MPTFIRLATCANVVFAIGTAHAAESLDFDNALALAQQRSGLIAAQQSAVASAREMAIASGQRPDPTLKAGINNVPVNGEDRFSIVRDFMTQRSIGIAQEWTREDKLKARSERAQREVEAEGAGLTLTLADLQRDVAMAWIERRYRERTREQLQALRNEAALQIEAAELAYRSARGTQADVFVARSAVAQIDDRIDRTEQQIAASTATLARWIGREAGRSLGAAPSTENVSIDDATLEDIAAHHPQLGVMSKRAEMADAETQIARANRSADWTVEVMYNQRGPSYSNMVSLNVSIPLQWDRSNRQDRDLAAKLATTERLRAQLSDATREHAAEIKTMLLEWRSGRTRLARYEQTLIPLATERTRAATLAYRNAAGTLTSVVEARRAEIETRLEHIALALDTDRVWARLNFLVPRDVAMSSGVSATDRSPR